MFQHADPRQCGIFAFFMWLFHRFHVAGEAHPDLSSNDW